LAISGPTARWAALRSAFSSSALAPFSGVKVTPDKWPTTWPSTVTAPSCADAGQHGLAVAQLPHQHAGAPVDEPGHQLLVQGVADPVFQLPGQALPVGGVGQPVGRLAM
jgi:hypothetical protein